jgi:hypothetical protein
MNDETTTGTDAADNGADLLVAEPESTALAEPAADQEAEPQEQQPNADEAPAEPPTKADENLAWLQKKGIDPTDPEAVSKIADMARNAEKKMHQSTVKASELEKSLQQDIQTADANGDEDLVSQLAQEVQGLKLTQSVNAFFSTGSPEEVAEKKGMEPAMAAIVTDNPQIGQLVKTGYLSYDQLYAMAKGSDNSREQQLKQDGGREALQQVANKQQARAIPGQATTSELSPAVEDPFLAGFDKSSSH